jgi:isoquinoline 1-oxidoreductase subunit alpha
MNLLINGDIHVVQSDGDTPLLWVIRDELGMTGTKYGCGLAQCGACSVLVDDVLVRSCVTPIENLEGMNVTTIEAIERDELGKRVVAAWVEQQVPQCGYCQSGQVLAATALLKQTATPTDAEIAAAMGNLCRCGTYNAIKRAVRALTGHQYDEEEKLGSNGPLRSRVIEDVALGSAAALVGITALTTSVSKNGKSDLNRDPT